MKQEPHNRSFGPAIEAVSRKRALEDDLRREKLARRAAEALAVHSQADLELLRHRVDLLARIADASDHTNDPSEILAFALERICTALGYSVGNGLLAKGHNGERRLEACGVSFAAHATRYEPFIEASQQVVAWAGLGIPGRALIDHMPHWQHAIDRQTDFARAALAADAGLRSVMVVPILAGEELVGAFELFTRDDRQPDGGQVEILRLAGTQVGRVFKRERNEMRLRENALRDPLTGLPNRALFEERMRELFTRRKAAGEPAPSLVFVDLDGFKVVNDTLGHRAGDTILQDVGQRLGTVIEEMGSVGRLLLHRPDTAKIFRLGGDEFAILVDGTERIEIASEIADAVHLCLAEPHRDGGVETPVSAAIGIVHDDGHYEYADELARDAETAVGVARRGGKGRTVVFDQAMRARALETLRIEAELRRAIENREFELHFQPIFSMPSREIAGYEALLRWRRESGRIALPQEFIQVAEDRGLIPIIGGWALRKACTTLKAMNARKPGIFMSVNVSARQFLQANLLDQIRNILDDTGADPASLVLEVTESAAILNPAQTARILDQLRAWKVRLTLDDFGTGHSSLSHLQTLRFDGIKIDKSFVMNQAADLSSWSIVNAILQLARAMDLVVVAEGIETEFQYAALAAMGCEMGQGFLFSKALPENEALALLG